MNERIVYTNPDGSVAIVIPSGDIPVSEVMIKDVPVDATNTRQITIAELPVDRLFRNAWDDTNPGINVGTDIVKAGVIAHDHRRAKREEEFAPHDDIIAKQVPGNDAAAAEVARAGIRVKYDTMQTDMDVAIGADDETTLRFIMTTNNLV